MDELLRLCISESAWPLTVDEIVEWFENVIFNGALEETKNINVPERKISNFGKVLSTRFTCPRDTSLVWAKLENEYSFRVFECVRRWISRQKNQRMK